MVVPSYVITTFVDLLAVGGLFGFYYFGEICNSIRIDSQLREGKTWDEIRYKTPLSKFLLDKKSKLI